MHGIYWISEFKLKCELKGKISAPGKVVFILLYEAIRCGVLMHIYFDTPTSITDINLLILICAMSRPNGVTRAHLFSVIKIGLGLGMALAEDAGVFLLATA